MSWDEHAATWDDDEAVRAYAAAAASSLRDELARRGHRSRGARACDFGCGTGLLTEQLVEAYDRVDAVDASPAMLEVLDAKIERFGWHNVETAGELPADGPAYDLIVASSVFAFVDDYPGVVRRLAGRLAPDGVLVQWDWELDPSADEPFGLSRTAIDAALSAAGLTSVRVEVAFSVPIGAEVMRPLMGSAQRPDRNAVADVPR